MNLAAIATLHHISGQATPLLYSFRDCEFPVRGLRATFNLFATSSFKVHGAQERKYAACVGLRLCRGMRARLQAYTYYYAIFNYCVGASSVPASVLNIVGNQPLYTDPMPLNYAIETWPTVATKGSCLPEPNVYARSANCHPGDINVTTP